MDAIYDRTEEANLHLVFDCATDFTDSLHLIWDLSGEEADLADEYLRQLGTRTQPVAASQCEHWELEPDPRVAPHLCTRPMGIHWM